MFLSVKKCLKLKPVNPTTPAVPVTSLTLLAVSPEGPLNAMSPPSSLSENPTFIVIVTVTWLLPVSLIFTVPTDPEIPKLFEVKSKLTELADAREDPTKTKTKERNSDLAKYTRT